VPRLQQVLDGDKGNVFNILSQNVKGGLNGSKREKGEARRQNEVEFAGGGRNQADFGEMRRGRNSSHLHPRFHRDARFGAHPHAQGLGGLGGGTNSYP